MPACAHCAQISGGGTASRSPVGITFLLLQAAVPPQLHHSQVGGVRPGLLRRTGSAGERCLWFHIVEDHGTLLLLVQA